MRPGEGLAEERAAYLDDRVNKCNGHNGFGREQWSFGFPRTLGRFLGLSRIRAHCQFDQRGSELVVLAVGQRTNEHFPKGAADERSTIPQQTTDDARARGQGHDRFSPRLERLEDRINPSGHLTLTVSPASTIYGQPVTLAGSDTGQFASSDAGSTIGFLNNGTTLLGPTTTLDSNVNYSVTTTTIAAGTYSLTAHSTDNSSISDSSPAQPLTIAAASTSDQLVTYDANTSMPLTRSPVSGQQIAFVLGVFNDNSTGAAPTGTVQFSIDNTAFGSPVSFTTQGSTAVAVSGITSFTASSGTHVISAHYVNTDGDFTPPADTGFSLTATKPSTTTSNVTSSMSSSVYGNIVTLTASVGVDSPGGGTPTGMVTFSDQEGTIGTAALSGGVATFPTANLDVAHSPHTITASYAGDSNFMGSDDTGGMPLKLTVSPDNTQDALASFSNPVSGQAISFTAFVSNLAQPLAPTGSVQFSVDGSNFGSPVTLTPVNGNSNESFAVSSSTSFLAAQGTQTIAFDYTNSDGNFVSGATDSHSLTATPAATTTSVVGSSANPSVVGQTVTFSVTVSVQAPGGGVPTGSVSFMEGFSTLATAATQWLRSGDVQHLFAGGGQPRPRGGLQRGYQLQHERIGDNSDAGGQPSQHVDLRRDQLQQSDGLWASGDFGRRRQRRFSGRRHAGGHRYLQRPKWPSGERRRRRLDQPGDVHDGDVIRIGAHDHRHFH